LGGGVSALAVSGAMTWEATTAAAAAVRMAIRARGARGRAGI